MVNAEQAGLATANSRGLLNSSLAAEASQKAAIEAAFPIASQDATAMSQGILTGYQGEVNDALNSSKYLNEASLANLKSMASSQLLSQEATQNLYQTSYESAIKAGLSAQEAAQQANLTIIQGLTNSGLSAQDATQKISQAAYDAAIAAGLSRQQADQNRVLARQQAADAFILKQSEIQASKELSTQQFMQNIAEANNKATLDQQLEAIQQTGANYRQEVENSAKAIINAANLSSSEKTNFADNIRIAGDTFETSISNIQRDPNVPPEAKSAAIAHVQRQYMDTLTYLAAVYGSEIDWSALATPTPPVTEDETAGEGGGTASDQEPYDWTYYDWTGTP
jgi:hypothetical protein